MKKFISIFMALAVAVCYIVPAAPAFAEPAVADEGSKQVSLLFTHDMHSHMDSKEIVIDGKKKDIGGFARIKTVKDKTEEKYPGTFLVDAGDFAMGTAFQTIFRTEAPELVTMGKIGYDATVLGNHEFDYKVEGTADMLNAAVEKAGRDELPVMTGLNIDWKKTLEDKKTAKAGKKLKKAFDNYGVQDYTIIEKNGVKIAAFGLIGDDAIACAPEADLHFSDDIERAKQIVDEIKRNGEADMIVCLSHGGTGDSKEEYNDSDDVQLAKAVDGIDLIISGHSHTTFDKPVTINDTVLVCCGEYNHNIGHVVMEKTGNGKYKVKDYNLIPLDSSVEKDGEIQGIVEGYKSQINSSYFNKYGYSYDQVLAHNSVDFTPITEFGEKQGEDNLANLIADSYVYAVEDIEKGKKKSDPVDVAIIPAGSVRDSFTKGNITVSDAFDVSSLGSGPDGTVGYPVVSIYLTGKELKNAAEVDASVSPSMKITRLYTSGLGYSINEHRMFLNRAYDIGIVNNEGEEIEKLDNKKLYRVVGGLYTCQRLSLVKEQSHGLLSVEPKDKDGNIIEDINDAVVKDRDGSELKEWYVLAKYIDAFKGGEVPDYYEKTHDRKVVDNSFNPVKVLKNPNHIAVMIYAIALIPIVIIGGIVISIIRNRQRRRGYKKSIFAGSKNRTYSKVMSSRGVRPSGKHKFSMNDRRRKGRRRRY